MVVSCSGAVRSGCSAWLTGDASVAWSLAGALLRDRFEETVDLGLNPNRDGARVADHPRVVVDRGGRALLGEARGGVVQEVVEHSLGKGRGILDHEAGSGLVGDGVRHGVVKGGVFGHNGPGTPVPAAE